MFTSKEQLIRRTGRNTVDRYEFLKLLATEFKTTKSKEAKEQVLANLANFAYDPINYAYIRQLGITDIFLCTLSEENQNLLRFAAAGICNLCLDSINRTYILRNKGHELLFPLLSIEDEETVLSAITSLMFLITPATKTEILIPTVIERISELSQSANRRIKNLATIFLTDHSVGENKN